MTRVVHAVAVMTMLSATTAFAQSSPKVQFIEVQKDVKLEVVDWGGTGRPIVLLAGNTKTAHDFDEFAPVLARTNRVVAITRRGWGASSKPSTGYLSDRLGDDVLAVIDSLRLDRPVLAGHSFAGAELSSIGSRHPEKVAGLVYLDAVFGYAFYEVGHFETDENELRRSLESFHTAAEAGNVEELRRALTRILETDLPSLERSLREVLRATPTASSSPRQPLMPPRRTGATALMFEGTQRFEAVRAPVLALVAGNGRLPAAAARDSAAAVAWLLENHKAARTLMRTVPTARIVVIPDARHDLFRSNEADVLGAMHAFISSLR